MTATSNHSLSAPPRWPTLPPALAGTAITAQDSGYAAARSSYMAVGSPQLVFKARTEEHVRQAVLYAAQVRIRTGERIPFSVRSGGHGISGMSTNSGGIILDLSGLRAFELLDPESGTFRVEAGATWGQIASALAAHDLVISSGNFGDTGVGGLATAGGIGYFGRSQGLTLDAMIRARLVTADGEVRWVDDTHEPELFWAVRGGATQAGIATAFDFKATALDSVPGNSRILHQQLTYVSRNLARFTAEWGQWMREAPDQMESFLMIQTLGDGQHAIQARNVWAGDDALAARPALQAALEIAQVHDEHAQAVPYPLIVPTPNTPHVGQQRIQMRDVLVDVADEELGAALADSLGQRGTLLAELRGLGGAIARVPAEATAWGNRHQEVLAGTWMHPLQMAEQDTAFAPLQQLGTGTYGAYSSDIRQDAAALAWPGATGRKLVEISQQVDPQLLFDRGLTLRQH